MLITVEYVRRKVRQISRWRGSNEAAHVVESKLHYDVLKWIAEHPDLRDGSPSAQALATEAIKTKDIDFDRWCA